MIGLFIKDLLNLKTQFRFILLWFAMYGLISITSGNSAMLGAIMAIMAVMMPITALGYDEKAKWEKYALSMPLSRTDLVLSKYLLGVVFSVIAFVLNFIISLFIGFSSYKESLMLCMLLLSAGLLFLGVITPAMLKYGVEKGRIVMMILIFSPTAFVLLLNKLGINLPDAAFIEKFWYLLPVMSVLILCVSIAISVKIYSRKEF